MNQVEKDLLYKTALIHVDNKSDPVLDLAALQLLKHEGFISDEEFTEGSQALNFKSGKRKDAFLKNTFREALYLTVDLELDLEETVKGQQTFRMVGLEESSDSQAENVIWSSHFGYTDPKPRTIASLGTTRPRPQRRVVIDPNADAVHYHQAVFDANGKITGYITKDQKIITIKTVGGSLQSEALPLPSPDSTSTKKRRSGTIRKKRQ